MHILENIKICYFSEKSKMMQESKYNQAETNGQQYYGWQDADHPQYLQSYQAPAPMEVQAFYYSGYEQFFVYFSAPPHQFIPSSFAMTPQFVPAMINVSHGPLLVNLFDSVSGAFLGQQYHYIACKKSHKQVPIHTPASAVVSPQKASQQKIKLSISKMEKTSYKSVENLMIDFQELNKEGWLNQKQKQEKIQESSDPKNPEIPEKLFQSEFTEDWNDLLDDPIETDVKLIPEKTQDEHEW
jgi:hypothetical protein